MTVIVMGMEFESGSVPDFGSIRMTAQRHNNVNDYILNSEDVSKLYNVSNAADGSTAICIDNKDIYVLHMSEWKKFGGDSDDKSTLDGLITRSLLEIRNTRVDRIGSNAFQYCDNLITADFPNAASIGSSAFQYCGNLITADFPNAASIGSSAFQYCDKLIKIVLKGTEMVTLVSVSAFYGTPIASGTGYIYVPDNQVDNYKNATNWVTYANQIKGISELEEAE